MYRGACAHNHHDTPQHISIVGISPIFSCKDMWPWQELVQYSGTLFFGSRAEANTFRIVEMEKQTEYKVDNNIHLTAVMSIFQGGRGQAHALTGPIGIAWPQSRYSLLVAPSLLFSRGCCVQLLHKMSTRFSIAYFFHKVCV